MGKVHPQIDDRLRHFRQEQPVFFVATAPLAADGSSLRQTRVRGTADAVCGGAGRPRRGQRPQGPGQIEDYRALKNRTSTDGLPAVDW